MPSQLLDFVCLNNQHYVDGTKVCYRLEQQPGLFGQWLKMPLDALMAEFWEAFLQMVLKEQGTLGLSAQDKVWLSMSTFLSAFLSS